MPKRLPIRLNETVRSNALRRPFKPAVIWDAEIAGHALHVTRRRSFWCWHYSPRGVNPRTGKRWGSTRLELGNAMVMTVKQAQARATAAKALVMRGEDPHRDKLAQRASLTAQRSVLPQTVAETLNTYERALLTRQRPTLWTRKQSIRCARTACTFMKANALPLGAINASMVRLMVETIEGSDAQRWHVYGALNRFLTWCRKQGLVDRNVCDELDRQDRPRPGKPRDHVPSLATLRSVWTAAEDEGELTRDLLHLLLLMPLRRNEASGLRWSEVDFDQGRIRVGADRMKARKSHELPLSPPVRALLERRELVATGDLVFPSGANTPYQDWNKLMMRIRRKMGDDKRSRADRFSLHDTRRAFVSHLAGLFDVDALDQCLAHARRGIIGIYQHSTRWPERVSAMNAWADLVLDKARPDNIVSFARRDAG